MRMGQGVRTGLGHGGITCALQTQFSSFNSAKSDVSKYGYLDVFQRVPWTLGRSDFRLNDGKVGKKAGNTHISQDGGKYW